MLDKKAKRNLIIDAAIEVFSKKSFRKSNISEIAQKANVAEGTIYQYFRNKEDLFFSIPVEKAKQFSRELDLHLQGITELSDKIKKFIWYYLYFFAANPGYSRIVMLEMRVSKSFVKTKTYNSFRKSTKRILEIIQAGQEQGILRKDVDAYLIRQLILGILEHMVTRWLLKNQRYNLVKYYEDVLSLVINGIKAPKPDKTEMKSILL